MAYDFDLFVIGAGSGGLRSARFCRGLRAQVAVVGKPHPGGGTPRLVCAYWVRVRGLWGTVDEIKTVGARGQRP